MTKIIWKFNTGPDDDDDDDESDNNKVNLTYGVYGDSTTNAPLPHNTQEDDDDEDDENE